MAFSHCIYVYTAFLKRCTLMRRCDRQRWMTLLLTWSIVTYGRLMLWLSLSELERGSMYIESSSAWTRSYTEWQQLWPIGRILSQYHLTLLVSFTKLTRKLKFHLVSWRNCMTLMIPQIVSWWSLALFSGFCSHLWSLAVDLVLTVQRNLARQISVCVLFIFRYHVHFPSSSTRPVCCVPWWPLMNVLLANDASWKCRWFNWSTDAHAARSTCMQSVERSTQKPPSLTRVHALFVSTNTRRHTRAQLNSWRTRRSHHQRSHQRSQHWI